MTERMRALLAEATAPGSWEPGTGRFNVITTAGGDVGLADRHEDAALIAAAVNALIALLDVADSARWREAADAALADWEEAHGHVVNSERDALALEASTAHWGLRDALARLEDPQ